MITGRGRRIWVRPQDTPEYDGDVIDRVSDDEQMDRILDPFFTTKGFGVNTGLGLATVMGAVRQNGGFVTVMSQVGQSSRFEVHLPRLDAAADVSPITQPTRREPGHETVLVVDDDPNVLAVLVEALSRTVYTVIKATNASAASNSSSRHLATSTS